MNLPSEENGFCQSHAQLLLATYEKLTGDSLLPGRDTEDVGRRLFEAPFFVASHNTSDDPVLTYGNQTALDLFEMPWGEFTRTPSRFTAEAPERSERERLLSTVARQGYIDDYTGIRISKSGRRFRIHRATVWNLTDDRGTKVGQAATFSEWEYLSE